MATQIIYSKEFDKHDNSSHPENAQRLSVILKEFKKSGFSDEIEIVKPEILPEKILHGVHNDRMIQQIKDISHEGGAWIDLDTYVCRSDYETARLAAGGMLQACKKVSKGEIDNAFALVRPPGHHATSDRSMGFCLFNNAAIASNELSKKGKKVLIFDNDVHHGNGTQYIFYDNKDVMYQSIHLSPHYPGTGDIDEIGKNKGEGYTVNAPLSYGNGNQAVTELLDEVFLPIAKQFKPDIILFSTGYDSHHSDPLGGLRLTADFYGEMISKYQKIQKKIVCTLEGGYNLNWIGKCFVSQLGQMIGRHVDFKDKIREDKNVKDLIRELKNEMGSFWNI